MLSWRDPENPLAGGAERVSLGYLSGLAERGHSVYWFANEFKGAAPESVIDGVKIRRGGSVGSSIVKARQWYARQERFDLVIDQFHGIPWFAPWWCGTRCVAYIHEVLGPIWSSFYSRPMSAVGRWQERWTHWLYRNVPFWTACLSTKEALIRHGVKEVELIPYGVHTRALPELDGKSIDEPVRLIVLSRLAPNKRVDHAILALRELNARRVKAHLTIVGSGQSEAQLKRLVAELDLCDEVSFTGQLPETEKDEMLRAAHLLLHTSVREGWGLNVIEANAMGTPAVVYPVPGLMESTLNDETGIVVRQETPESLAEGITTLLKQPEKYRVYQENAWKRAQSFHWNQVLPRANDWLERLASDGSTNSLR